MNDIHDELPDPVEDFQVRVEKGDDGWMVVKEADGETSVIETHPDEESAQRQAALLTESATRHENMARVEEVPDQYPGKGEDERP